MTLDEIKTEDGLVTDWPIVAECWTCAYKRNGVKRPERLTEPRAHYHRMHGHDVRPIEKEVRP